MGHGHVIPNPDGSKARCGGPALCVVCADELEQVTQAAQSEPALSGTGVLSADVTVSKGMDTDPERQIGSVLSGHRPDCNDEDCHGCQH